MLLARLLIFRSMHSRLLRTLLSTFGIVLGVGGLLAMSATNRTALDSVSNIFKNTSGSSNLVILSSDATSRGFPERIMRRVSSGAGISEVIPLLQIRTALADEAPSEEIEFNFFGAGPSGLILFGIDPLLDPQVRDYSMVRGRFLSEVDLTAYEVVLVEDYAQEKEIELGDRVAVVVPAGAVELRVVGLMARDGPGRINNGAFGALPLRTAQELFHRPDELDQIDLVAFEPAEASLAELKKRLQARLGQDYVVVYPAAQGQRMAQMLGNYQIGLNFLSGIALFVGAFLIYNAFAMTVAERTREWGMLRTIGMTRAQIMRQVLTEAAMLGLTGSLFGACLGIGLAWGLIPIMENVLGQQLGKILIPPETVISSLLVGIVVTVLAAALPAWQASTISPLEALRVRSVSKEGWLIQNGWKLGLVLLIVTTAILILNPFPNDVRFRLGTLTVGTLFLGATLTIPASVGLWERATRPIVQRLYGNCGRLGSGNIERTKRRTTLTVAALMIGVAMIIIVRGMTGSFQNDLTVWTEAYIGGDLSISSAVTMRRDVKRRLEAVEGVAVVAPVRYFDVKWVKPDGAEEVLTFLAIDPLLHAQVTSFIFSDSDTAPVEALSHLAEGNAVFVSTVLSEKYDLTQGDTIRLKTRSGLRDFEIAGVVVDFYNQGLVVEGSWNDMRRYFRINDANAYQVSIKPGYPIDEVRERIDGLYRKRDHLTIESNAAIKERIFRLMSQSNGIFDLLALIAVVVAALGVVNTLLMNVMERTREIGMLRGIGMTRRQVIKMIMAEAGLMGLIGGILGLVFGLILSRIFLLAMNAMSGYNLSYVLSPLALLVGLFIALVVSQLAAFLPARRAVQIDILKAIHYE